MKVYDLQVQNNIQRIQPGDLTYLEKIPAGVQGNQSDVSNLTFDDVLLSQINSMGEIKFSGHALNRLTERDVKLTNADYSRLEQGLKQVEEKGASKSLILVDENAFIVSVKNKTVVTALSMENTASNVFTNIDSVAIV
jgi:flagellar operon protein